MVKHIWPVLFLLSCGTESGEPILAATKPGSTCEPGTDQGGGPVGAWACVADLVPNASIDLDDLTHLLAQIGCAPGTGDAACDAADLTFDCAVDEVDVGILSAVQGTSCSGATPAPAYWPCAADVDDSGTVEASDQSLVAAEIGCSVGTAAPKCQLADVDRNQSVTQADVQIVSLLIGRTCP